MPKQIVIVDQYIDETALKGALIGTPHVVDINDVEVRNWRTLRQYVKPFTATAGMDERHWLDKKAATFGGICVLVYSWRTKSHLPGEPCVREFLPVRDEIRRMSSRCAEWRLRPNGEPLRIR